MKLSAETNLETLLEDSNDLAGLPFRLPVQAISADDGCMTGKITSGQVSVGDSVKLIPGGVSSEIVVIEVAGNSVQNATAGQKVSVTLSDKLEVASGCVLAESGDPPQTADQFAVKLLWKSNDELLPGRPYLFKTVNHLLGGSITDLKYRINPDTDEHIASKTLHRGERGICNIALDEDIAFDHYADNPLTGSFTLIDRLTDEVAAFGMIDFALRRSANIHWQALHTDKRARADQKQQKPAILWFTGLSASGKSTIANKVDQLLLAEDRHTYLLDGDNVRHGLSQDLGFTDADRVENIRRVGEVAKLMVDAGLVVMTSFISPFRAERQMVRRLVDDDEFIEIFIDTPLEVCAERDPKGLYKKAMAGELKNFTGYDSPYEPPENPDIRLDTQAMSADQCAQTVLQFLKDREYLA